MKLSPLVYFLACVCAVGLFIYSIANQKTLFFQETRSHAIEQRTYFGPFLVRRVPIFAGVDFEKEKAARWFEGIELAFRRPIRIGESALARKGSNTFILRILSIDPTEIGYTWGDVRGSQLEETNSAETIYLGDIVLPWSYKSEGEVWLYADQYYQKSKESLYRLRYPITNALDAIDPVSLSDGEGWRRYPWE